MKEFFEKCQPIFESHKDKKHVEFEMRLGKMNGKMFDTNVGEKAFNEILEALRKYKDWERVTESKTSVYYKGNTRMIIDEDTEDTTVVKKSKIQLVDHCIPDRPFDVRFCVSKELPGKETEMDDVMDYVRNKNRISFVRKNLSIDMTTVTGQPDDLDDESEMSYEVELEIIDPKIVNDKNTLYNIIHKVECVLKTLH